MKATRYEHGTYVATPRGIAEGMIHTYVANHRTNHSRPEMTPGSALTALILTSPFVAGVSLAFAFALGLMWQFGNPILIGFCALFALGFTALLVASLIAIVRGIFVMTVNAIGLAYLRRKSRRSWPFAKR